MLCSSSYFLLSRSPRCCVCQKTCAGCAKRKRSALPSGPEYQISGRTANRAPCRRKPTLQDELTEIGSLSKWPSLRHANDNKHRL